VRVFNTCVHTERQSFPKFGRPFGGIFDFVLHTRVYMYRCVLVCYIRNGHDLMLMRVGSVSCSCSCSCSDSQCTMRVCGVSVA